MSAPLPAGRALGAPLLAHDYEPTIFEFSAPGRHAASFRTTDLPAWPAEELVPDSFLRSDAVVLPEVSERDLVAHFTRLTHRQYSVDLGAYPLGSCTMKYNPKAADAGGIIAWLHPGAPGRPRLVHTGLVRVARRARGEPVRDHGHGRRHLATGGGCGGRAHRPALDARLPRVAGRVRASAQGHHP